MKRSVLLSALVVLVAVACGGGGTIPVEQHAPQSNDGADQPQQGDSQTPDIADDTADDVVDPDNRQIDEDPVIPEGPPPVIAPEVQETYEFTMTLPKNTAILADGMVTSCPSTWTGTCPEYYAFSFHGYFGGTILYDFTVSIDQVDTGNLPYVPDEVEVLSDGSVVVVPTFINEVPTAVGDAGAPPPDDWSTGAARARSANHVFRFVLNGRTVEQAKINEIFTALMSTFRVTVLATPAAK